jgi:DNA-binding response OmpR family regulator
MNTKILVVDDEPDFVQLMTYNLTRAGFVVLQASNGLNAVHLARRHVPDVVLLDVMMPGFDGFAVCEVLGWSSVTSRVPVILLTALDGAVALPRAMRAGAVKQLTKPVPFPTLLATVQEVVQGRRELFPARAESVGPSQPSLAKRC